MHGMDDDPSMHDQPRDAEREALRKVPSRNELRMELDSFRCPARTSAGIRCVMDRGHGTRHTDGVWSWGRYY